MEQIQALYDDWQYIVEEALSMRTVQLKRTTLLAKLKEILITAHYDEADHNT